VRAMRLVPLLQETIPRTRRYPLRLARRRPDLEEQRRRVVERAIALGRAQDIGGQAAGDDGLVHEPPVGQQALLVARLVAKDEQEQVLAAARAGVDGRGDALGGAER